MQSRRTCEDSIHPAAAALKGCFYCGDRHNREWDHFPSPWRAGGRQVVPSCVHCHRLKTHTSARVQRELLDNTTCKRLFEAWWSERDVGELKSEDAEAFDAYVNLMHRSKWVFNDIEDGYAASQLDMPKEEFDAAMDYWLKWSTPMRLAIAQQLDGMHAAVHEIRDRVPVEMVERAGIGPKPPIVGFVSPGETTRKLREFGRSYPCDCSDPDCQEPVRHSCGISPDCLSDEWYADEELETLDEE